MVTPATPEIIAAGTAFENALLAFNAKRVQLQGDLADLSTRADETETARDRVAPPPPLPSSLNRAIAAADAIDSAVAANAVNQTIVARQAELQLLLTGLQNAEKNA
jgi:hypothetical protein